MSWFGWLEFVFFFKVLGPLRFFFLALLQKCF